MIRTNLHLITLSVAMMISNVALAQEQNGEERKIREFVTNGTRPRDGKGRRRVPYLCHWHGNTTDDVKRQKKLASESHARDDGDTEMDPRLGAGI